MPRAARRLGLLVVALFALTGIAFSARIMVYAWGTDLSASGDHRPAFHLIRASALLGYPLARSTLGAMYLTGQGTPVDGKEAALWLERAGRAGEVQAQAVLGMMLLFGKAVPADQDKARYWLTRAAAGGDAEAAFLLRSFYASSAQ